MFAMQSPLTHHERVAELELELARARQALDDARADHHAAQAALRHSEEFKTRMIEGSMDCIKVLDLEGRLLSMNAGGMQVLEISDFGPFCNAPWPDLWPEK